MKTSSIEALSLCYHCGDTCPPKPLLFENKAFCCDGCQTVYQLLQENGLCTYYDLDKKPGLKIKASPQERFAYLDNEEIAHKLCDFDEGNKAKISLYIPKIHCSSCIWLLENLYKIEKGVLSSRVNFLKKEIDIFFNKEEASLRHLVEVLDSLGYTPDIHLHNYTQKGKDKEDKSLYYKIGIAGFCASNIMMFSFPEYLGLDVWIDKEFKVAFTYLNLLFSLPVVLYSANDYFVSAWKGIKSKVLTLDIPIVLGTLAVFLRSSYEVLAQVGTGYFDSLSGLLFFLLIGKWIQSHTYKHLSFDRDYQSYFPIAATKLIENKEVPIPIHQLAKGDYFFVRNNEIVPTDARLEDDSTLIDYSFVTGESQPIHKVRGELVYAGGKLVGSAARFQAEKEVASSYLLQLWNNKIFKKNNNAYLSAFVLSFSKYFVYGTLGVAFCTGFYWYFADVSKLLFSVTSVLLVACPCALALSLPFALSNGLRLLSRRGLFLKNADTIEKLAEIDTLVFDKTGTLTNTEESSVHFVGAHLSEEEQAYVRSVSKQSLHPLCKAIYASLPSTLYPVVLFEESTGKGISGYVHDVRIRLGSAHYLTTPYVNTPEAKVYVEIDGCIKGYFVEKSVYRKGYAALLQQLKSHFDLHLLSGDTDGESKHLMTFFVNENMRFFQQPNDKLHYVENLQQKGKKIMMLGDGLNDAGALKAADLGIAVAEDVCHFVPASDGILQSNRIVELPHFLRFAKSCIRIIKMSLALSLLYNVIGLYFAVQGLLSPLIAAILMPMSSVTVVTFVVLATTLSAKFSLPTSTN